MSQTETADDRRIKRLNADNVLVDCAWEDLRAGDVFLVTTSDSVPLYDGHLQVADCDYGPQGALNGQAVHGVLARDLRHARGD